MATIIEMVEELQRQMAAVQTAVASIQTNVSGISNTIAPYPSRFTSIESRVTANETCCSGNSARITTLEGNVGTLSTGLNSVQSTVATVQSSVGTLADTMSNYPARFTAIENNIGGLDTAISAVETGVEDVESDIAGIQTVITGLQSATSGLQTSVATLTDGQNTANGRITGVESSATALADQYTAQQLEINALKAQDVTTIANVAANTKAIANAQNKISENATDIAAIEAKQADTGWIDLNLSSGWTKTNYATENPQYRKIGNTVYLKGLVNATAAAGTTIAVLPGAFRPFTNFFTRYAQTNGTGDDTVNIQVSNTGAIVDYTKGSQARTFVSLYGISFTTD